MNYFIDKASQIPSYIQLYTQVREDIIKGIFPYGSKLPSKRVVADEVKVSTVTVEHAYNLLCDEGYIESKERSGYFVIFCVEDGFYSAAAKSTKTVHHTTEANYPPSAEFPFSVLAKTMRNVISDYGKVILERSDNAGCVELRDAICGYLARSRGICVESEQIVIGAGSEYLYNLIVGLMGRDKVYAIESPSYKKIEQVYSSAGVQLEKLHLNHDGIDTLALNGSTANVLHISPYRSYPSGVTASASKRHEYLRWADKGNRFIIEDDFESEFSVSSKPEETLFTQAVNENVIYMNSFSKTVSPSFRVGYMVLPKSLAYEFCNKLGFYSCTVPSYIQFVLAELISNGDFERHVNRVRRNKRKELKNKK